MRLSLFLLSHYPEQERSLVAGCLTNRQFFENENLRREYGQLLQSAYNSLEPADQETILGWIVDGPPDMESVAEGHVGAAGRLLANDEVRAYRQRWQRDWYARIESALPQKHRLHYQQLVEEYGTADLPERPRLPIARAFAVEGYSPKSAEELLTMPMRELVKFLKAWRPAPDNNLFQQAPSYRGLREALFKAVVREPMYFARHARQLRALDPLYIQAIFEGLLQAAKQHQSLRWNPVLDLCLSVARKRRSPCRGAQGGYRTHRQWKETCMVLLDLLTWGCDGSTALFPVILRQQIWDVLTVLTEDENPTVEEEQRFADEKDRADLPQATIRGKALFTVLAYAQWIQRAESAQTAEADDEGSRHGFTHLPEVQDVLEKHLDVQHDPSFAIRAFYGQMLPILVSLDPAWITRNLTRIFPMEAEQQTLWAAAWRAYCLFCRPGGNLVNLLADEYHRAIDELGSDILAEHPFHPSERLVEHLMLLYCWNRINFGGQDGLLDHFYGSAPVAMRSYAFDYLGHLLAQQPGPPDATVLSRLQELWERRVMAITQSRGELDAAELAPFRWWFNSGFSPDA